jgi:hypothetical protein
MVGGRVALEGSAADIRDRRDIGELFLGKAAGVREAADEASVPAIAQ